MSGFFRNERSVHAGDVVPGLFERGYHGRGGVVFRHGRDMGRVWISGTTIIERS